MTMKRIYNSTTRYEELRLDYEKRQGDIANVLSVKRNTYSKWENYINDMPIEKSNELSNYYNSSLDYLLGLSNNRNYVTERNTIDFEKLSKRLLETRKKRKITQDALGDKLGFNQRTYAHYEKGDRIPTTLKLLIIAQYYDISVDYLVGRTDSKEIK